MFNLVIGIGTIALQVGILIAIFGLVTKNTNILSFISNKAKLLLALIFIGATVGSFIYQYVFGYEPCLLCWYQRLAIVPIGILSLTADIRDNAVFRKQVLILSILGLGVALFHNYIDIYPTGIDVCGINGVSCLRRYVYEFSYITIPMMSATVLLSGVLLSVITRRYPHGTIVE